VPIGLLVAFFISDNKEVLRKRAGYNKKCPLCAEFIKSDALTCKHCGKRFN